MSTRNFNPPPSETERAQREGEGWQCGEVRSATVETDYGFYVTYVWYRVVGRPSKMGSP